MEDLISRCRKIKLRFDRNYFFVSPYAEYVRGSSLLTYQECQEQGITISSPEGKSLDDYCLVVSLRRAPKDKVKFPPVYEGMKVAYRVTG